MRGIKLSMPLILLIVGLCFFNAGATVTNVYEVVTINKFNFDFPKHFGCQSRSEILYGTYIYDIGYRDAAAVLTAPYQFQLNPECGVTHKYFKVFGTNQDYKKLLSSPPSAVAGTIKNLNMPRSGADLVVDWAYPSDLEAASEDDLAKMWKWLAEFTNALDKDVLIKIEAPLLCYNIQGQPALKNSELRKVGGWIVKTYGPGTNYLSYQSLFTNTNYQAEPHYSVECPKNPSLTTLAKVAGRQVYLQKTLHKEVKGYMGNIDSLAERAEKEGIKVGKLFYDMLPESIIVY